MSERGRRRFLRYAAAGLTAVAVYGVEGIALAAEVEISATLGRSQLEVGRSGFLQVEVAVSGGGQIAAPKLGGLDGGIDVTERGASTGMSVEISGGRQVRRSTKTYTYVLTPRKAGEYELDISVEVDGQTHRPARKPKLIVTGEDYVPTLEHGKASDAPTSPDSEVIVWPVVDKSEVYVGEQLVYELQIWERVRGNLNIASAPTFKDFWSEDLLTPQQQRRLGPERKLVANTPYRVHRSLRRALFPQRAGTLTIGGPEIQTQELVGSFFGRATPPQSYFGRSLAIDVKPLPAEGQPPGFRANNVGQLKISTAVDRTDIRAGEAVRLTVAISGVANIALIDLPALPELDGLRSYEPKPQPAQLQTKNRRLEGTREFTMLVVADEAGELTIPAFELPYFDPKVEAYRTATSEPITLNVAPNPNAGSGQTPGDDASEGADGGEGDERDPDDELLAPAFAGAELPRVMPRERWLTRERWWIGTLAAPALLGLSALGLRLRERFGPDDASKARTAELGRRKQLLADARAALDGGEGFYPKLAELLQGAAVGRAGPRGVGLTRARLIDLLAEQDVAREELDELRELLDACDAARFGAGPGDLDQRRADLERAEALLAKRSWRPA